MDLHVVTLGDLLLPGEFFESGKLSYFINNIQLFQKSLVIIRDGKGDSASRVSNFYRDYSVGPLDQFEGSFTCRAVGSRLMGP